MAEKKNPLGPTGQQVRVNIRRYREQRRLSYRELSDRLSEAGRPIPTLGLSRIENGERRVDADDLVALAAALHVNPSALLLPPEVVGRRTGDAQTRGTGDVQITGVGTVPGWLAWGWVDGYSPLIDPQADEYQQALLDFLTNVRPPGWDARTSVGLNRGRAQKLREAFAELESDDGDRS